MKKKNRAQIRSIMALIEEYNYNKEKLGSFQKWFQGGDRPCSYTYAQKWLYLYNSDINLYERMSRGEVSLNKAYSILYDRGVIKKRGPIKKKEEVEEKEEFETIEDEDGDEEDEEEDDDYDEGITLRDEDLVPIFVSRDRSSYSQITALIRKMRIDDAISRGYLRDIRDTCSKVLDLFSETNDIKLMTVQNLLTKKERV